jgi:hypothetical protein
MMAWVSIVSAIFDRASWPNQSFLAIGAMLTHAQRSVMGAGISL